MKSMGLVRIVSLDELDKVSVIWISTLTGKQGTCMNGLALRECIRMLSTSGSFFIQPSNRSREGCLQQISTSVIDQENA